MGKMTLIEAADAALASLRAMTDEELMTALEACEGGWISTAIQELGEFAEYLEANPIPAQPQVHITKEMVQSLREESGLGMMECKKALCESNGDHNAAYEILRRGTYRGTRC